MYHLSPADLALVRELRERLLFRKARAQAQIKQSGKPLDALDAASLLALNASIHCLTELADYAEVRSFMEPGYRRQHAAAECARLHRPSPLD